MCRAVFVTLGRKCEVSGEDGGGREKQGTGHKCWRWKTGGGLPPRRTPIDAYARRQASMGRTAILNNITSIMEWPPPDILARNPALVAKVVLFRSKTSWEGEKLPY